MPEKELDWKRIYPLMGTEPDARIAKRFGCSDTLIGKRRNEIGIPPYRARIRWNKVDDLLGKVPDSVVAAKARTDAHTVSERRATKGIPARGKRTRARRPSWATDPLHDDGTEI